MVTLYPPSRYTITFIITSILLFSLTVHAQENVNAYTVKTSDIETIPPATTTTEIINETNVTPETGRQRELPINIEPARLKEQSVSKQDLRQQRVLNLSANISNRMDAANNRLTNITARLETRIAKLEQAGYATELASAELNTAKDSLLEVQNLLNDIDPLVYNATMSTAPGEAWKLVKERYLQIGQLLRTTHQNLRAVIALLKTAPLLQANQSATTSEIKSQVNPLMEN